MRVVHWRIGETPELSDRLTLCLGTFDGVHLGHQRLFLEARLHGEGETGVLLFSENPSHYLDNGKAKCVLTSLQDKINLASQARLDVAYVLDVDSSFFSLPAQRFVDEILSPLHPSCIAVGSDFSFGKGARGGLAMLKKSFEVLVVGLYDIGGEKVSTRSIIKALEEGDIAKASSFLGRPYEISGQVIHGLANGRKIGFPTANIALSSPYQLPKQGVYQVIVYRLGLPYKGVLNIGVNPTIGVLSRPSVEVYLENFDQDIYGETLYVDFLAFIRDDRKFASLGELKKQLDLDLKFGKDRIG